MSIAVPAARGAADLRAKAAVLLAVLVTVLSLQAIDAPEWHAWSWHDTGKWAVASWATTSLCWGLAGGLALETAGASLAAGATCEGVVGGTLAAAMAE